jgi:enoyl-CoA hydratase
VKELLNGKSLAQIHAIIETFNNADEGAEDPSKGKFEAALEASLK